MKIVLSFLVCWGMCSWLYAQEGNGLYRVKSGSDVTKTIPVKEQFQYKDFVDGVAYYRNGRKANAKLNYNLAHGEVMFISPEKDTMLFSENKFFYKVDVGGNSYYFNEGVGHVEIIGDYDRAKLGRKQFLVRAGEEKYAAYGQYSSTSATTGYSSFINANGEFQHLQSGDKIVMKRRVIYYFMDKNLTLYLANRSNLLKIHPGNKRALNEYLKDNQISFDNEEDLRNVLEFCMTL
ncbi:hypothetical protein [Dyadobacter bucti]|uniref:hypothetical protein n=1 Tax=Dyadobacter bucti TaxID=2572203 RepID=UPI003F6F1323